MKIKLYKLAIKIVLPLYILGSFFFIPVSYSWTTIEHRDMVPFRADFDLHREQFSVGKGDVVTGTRDRWRYSHLLVAADFFQNWQDFRNAFRSTVIKARKTIDKTLIGGTSNHDLVSVFDGNMRFVDVAINNRDHFQPYAQRRWRNMHAEAIKRAQRYGLKAGLVYNGFADHFLADVFAAGHQLDYTKIRNKYGRSGGNNSVKSQHDRLNRDGLNVTNNRGDIWKILGDGYFHKMEEKGQRITIEAIALSIDDIFLAAKRKNVPKINGRYRAEELIPKRYIQKFQWSYAGRIRGKHCVQINEPSLGNDGSSHTWGDNYLCSNKNYGIRWSFAGPIRGMRCVNLHESASPHTWGDNYLCIPSSSPIHFSWSSAGPIRGKRCVQINEPADPHTWNDNYLCY